MLLTRFTQGGLPAGGKMPDLEGFHNQEVPLPRIEDLHTEMVNSRPLTSVSPGASM